MTQLYIGTIIESEYELAKEVVKKAFLNTDYVNAKEHELIGRIRKSPHYNAELEVVAKTEGGKILGHAMMTEVTVDSEEDSNTVLTLRQYQFYQKSKIKGLVKL